MKQMATPESTITPTINKFQVGDWLTITTILFTLSAAIFYFAGWVYEAYWYGFFGINLTQINIPLQQIMIEGLPGIVIIAISSSIAIMVFNLFPRKKKKSGTNPSFVWVMVSAYGLCVLVVFVIGILYRDFLDPLPIEIGISGFGLAFVFIVLILLQFYRRNRISFLLNATKDFSPLLMSVALSSLSLFPVGGSFSSLLGDIGAKMLSDVYDSIKEENPKREEMIAIDIINAWRVWSGLVILFFILLSLTTSAILGRANAHLGQRLMMGGWQMNEIFIYSSKPDLPLPHSSASYAEKGYTYGPFGIIANDDQVYYLVDWKVGDHYEARPNLYAIPRSNDTSLVILYAPQSTPTPLPSPTVTFTPLSTATSLPSSASPTP